MSKLADSMLTTDDVAAMLKKSRSFVLGLAMSGELTGVRVGRSLRFEPDGVAAYVARHRLVIQNDDGPLAGGPYVRTPGVEAAGRDGP